MKIGIYVLIIIALGLIIYNATKLNFDDLFTGDSAIASISILASSCAILLLWILRTSMVIAKKKK